MIDMLVRLYALPPRVTGDDRGWQVRRARAFELHAVCEFVRQNFSAKWVSEVTVAMSRQPISCFIATQDRRIIGFSCYETTLRGFFGPMGVHPDARKLGLGQELLMVALESMREMGYAYAIIGGVGPREFYEKTCGAVEIVGSDPGTYTDLLP